MDSAILPLQIAVAATAIKLLLVPTYHSTDFEVHRNWLAITHSLPLTKWYYEKTSEWTLDYPPLFAWMEWMLSHLGKLVDPEMLVVSNLNYASEATVLFQRGSVMVLDVVYMLAVWAVAKRQAQHRGAAAGTALYVVLVLQAGLLLVDHIHFQYNGVMLGLLLWSLHCIQEQRPLLAALLFAALLNLKHLFVYAAPLYFVYLLRTYCVGRYAFRRFLGLGAAVGSVCVVSFGPFVAAGQMGQILSRLFPFGRGLCHSYWAANFWALYSAADKVLAVVLPRFGAHVERPLANMAGGAVGVSQFVVLPQVGPRETMGLVLLALLPCLMVLWRRPKPHTFAYAVAYAYLTGFMFGYHVHEKAILPALVPLAIPAVQSPTNAARLTILSAAGLYGLLPLLFRPQEYLPKMAITLGYLVLLHALLRYVHRKALQKQRNGALLSRLQRVYMLGFVGLEVLVNGVHPMVLGTRLPFLPLMMTSVYCALGVTWVWGSMLLDRTSW